MNLVRQELDRRAFHSALPYFATTQRQDRGKWERFAQFALEKGLIDRPVATGDLYRNP